MHRENKPRLLKHTGATGSLGYLFYKGTHLVTFTITRTLFVISLPAPAPALVLCLDAQQTALTRIIKNSVRFGVLSFSFLLSFVWP